MRPRLDVAAAKVSFDATRAAASLHGELLRFAGGAEQAGLVSQVEAIAQTVSGLQAARTGRSRLCKWRSS